MKYLIVFILGLIASPQHVGAQVSLTIGNPLGGGGTLTSLIDGLTTWIFNIGIPIALIVIIWAGIKMVTSRGNPGTVGEAKSMLWYGIVGLAIILIGRGFVALVQSVLSLG